MKKPLLAMLLLLSPATAARVDTVPVGWLKAGNAPASYMVDVQPFAPLDAKLRRGISQEAEALGSFLGAPCGAQFA